MPLIWLRVILMPMSRYVFRERSRRPRLVKTTVQSISRSQPFILIYFRGKVITRTTGAVLSGDSVAYRVQPQTIILGVRMTKGATVPRHAGDEGSYLSESAQADMPGADGGRDNTHSLYIGGRPNQIDKGGAQ